MTMKPKTEAIIPRPDADTAVEGDAQFRRMNFDAYLTTQEMEHLEEIAIAPNTGQARRMSLAVLTRSKRELSSPIDASVCLALLKSYDSIQAYKKHLEGICELVDLAALRLLYVLEEAVHDNPALANVETEDGILRVRKPR